MAGPLSWPAGGFPTSVWFVRRRGDTIDQLVAPWFRDAHPDEEGLRAAFELAKQRVWTGTIPGRYLHLTLADERIPGALAKGQTVLVRGPDLNGMAGLPRDVPLGYLTDTEISGLVSEAGNGTG